MTHPAAKYLPFLVLLLLWELGARAGLLNAVFFSSPTGVLNSAIYWYGSGKILPQLGRTLGEILVGGGSAFVVGVPLGILIGWYRSFSDTASPVLLFLDAVPAVALGPVLPLVLGLGPWTSIMLVFYLTMLPLAINVAAGVRIVSDDLVRMSRHFGAGDPQLLATIVLPSTVPYILGATRGNIGRGLAGALVGEWLGSNAGLGSMMFDAAGVFELKTVYVGALTVVLVSLVASALLGRVENRLYRWRPA